MNKKVLIVAHPDDEVLFFSSILNKVDKIIFCFGPSSNQVVTKGREILREKFPLPNVEWLNLNESNVFLASNWNNPCLTIDGVYVNRHRTAYRKTYEYLSKIFKQKIDGYDTVYTHNPWGEYGHEEHVSVFNAILNSVSGSNKQLFVSCYASDVSKKLFLRRKELLEGDIQVGLVPQKLCVDIKRLYIKYDCWTWDDQYEWPTTEIFAKIRTSETSHLESVSTLTAYPPIMFFSQGFRLGIIRQKFAVKILAKILPKKVKNVIKSIIYKGTS